MSTQTIHEDATHIGTPATTDLKVQCFPDHELSDHRGKHRTLPELQEGDPLVLMLFH